MTTLGPIGRMALPFGAAALLVLQATMPTFAQGAQPCACLAQPAGSAATVGTIVSARGEVMMSLRDGYRTASAGAPLEEGSQVMVGPDGAALLAVGSNCRLDIPAGSDVSLTSVPDGICVAVTEPLTTAQVPDRTNSNALLYGIAGGLAVGGAVAIIIGSDGNGPASN